MGDVNHRRELLRNIVASILIVAVTLAATWMAISFGKLSLLGVVGGVGLIVAAYIGVRHPLWFYWGLAAIMAGLQFGRIPGISLPIYLPLAFGAVVASFFHPRLAQVDAPTRIRGPGVDHHVRAVRHGDGALAYLRSLFIRWAIPSLVMLALVQLSSEHLARFGRIFAVVAALNALYGIYCVAFDPTNSSLKYLRVFGYTRRRRAARFAYVGQGDTGTVRLGGTWVDPNGAAAEPGVWHLALRFCSWPVGSGSSSRRWSPLA